jgi:hypothetical protein
MVSFQAEICNLGPFLEGLAMEDVGVFYGHLISFTAI